jgi:plastocyanin
MMRRGVRALVVAGALALVAAPAGAQAVSVQFASFSPTPLDVLPGETVVWTNVSERRHTVTSDAGAFASGDLLSGDRFTWTFRAAGRSQDR